MPVLSSIVYALKQDKAQWTLDPWSMDLSMESGPWT